MVYRYRIDADNRIAWVSNEWLEFARDNDASELSRDRVVGQPLFSFIWGSETEYLYYLLLDQVRLRSRAVEVPFRCDSPTHRRSMSLRLRPLEKEAVSFEGRLLWEEPRTQVFLLDPAVARSDAILKICAWCKKIDVEGEWLEVEEAVDRLSLFQSPRLPRQHHGVCPGCDQIVHRLVADAASA